MSTPQHIAMLDHMCSQPSASPGDELVVPVMGILVFTALLQDTGLMRDDELCLYDKELVCESALDADNSSEVMLICSRLEALAALGCKSFRLSEILPGAHIGKDLAQKRFIVPVGRLSACKGMCEAQKLDGAATGRPVMRRPMQAELQIAFLWQGSNGHDGSVILVEEATPNRAWVLHVQSKHDAIAASPEITCREIPKWMHSDSEGMHRLPKLQDAWQKWHDGSKEYPLPEVSPSSEQWDDSILEHRVIFAYAIDGPFDKVQGELQQQLLARGHPWMQRVLMLSQRKHAMWQTYVGPLLRYICHAVQKNPYVRAALGEYAPSLFCLYNCCQCFACNTAIPLASSQAWAPLAARWDARALQL